MKRRAGFSLVETIFAAAMLLLVMMVLFNLYPASLLAVRRAEHTLEAITLAQSILEEKSAASFSQLAALAPDDWNELTPPPPKDDGVELRPKFQVFHIPDLDAGRVLGVRVKVEWDENERTHRSISQEIWIVDIKR